MEIEADVNADTLKRICGLQRQYSSANTPAMAERCMLIRRTLAGELRVLLPRIAEVVGDTAPDLEVDSSDGIGRKTEAPWVRVHSSSLSPTPREGYYFVIHFRADGAAVFFTVGCGSTIWKDGDLRAVSDAVLVERTVWARSIIEQRWKSVNPFDDVIQLGARANLPRVFEKATVIAKRIPLEELDSTDLDALVIESCDRLGEIYRAQRYFRDVQPADQIEAELAKLVNPSRILGSRQGFGLTGEERKLVDLRAMQLASEQLRLMGFECKDVSATESFDILATKGGQELKIEVKGTTSDFCDQIIMTANEVELHRRETGKTGLILVYGIRLRKHGSNLDADGGNMEILLGWDIFSWQTTPTQFRITRNR